MSTIVINGLAYSGKTVEVRNGRVLVDGKEAPAGEGKDIHIEVTGDIKNLRVDACAEVSVSGNCGEISVQSGDVKCGDVSGSVSTQSGDIRCGRVAGNVRTMAGDIMKR